jgi:hypothetical protein
MKVFGRDCDLQNVAFVVAQLGYTRDALKVSYTCQDANNDAQLMATLVRSKFRMKERYTDSVRSPTKWSLFMNNVRRNNLRRVQHWVTHGANVNAPDQFDVTPLFLCSNVDTTRYLVEQGADVNYRTYDGRTPLGWCRPLSERKKAEYLTEHGAVK